MEKAKDADQIKSAFLATMSHELRTPLNSIIGFTGILLQELAGDLNAEQKKQLSMVQNSSRHLLSLINDVLDISKIEAGQLVLAFDSFDLAKSIDKVVKIMHPLAEKKGLDIGVTIEGGVSAIYGDQRHVEQILLNLISNSVKFTEHGQIKLSCLVRSGICTLSVADTGIGMQQEEIGRLFLPFSQIDTGLTRKYEGTGLGLSICKKLIELMKGTISVESEYGKGSTFRIVFPVTKEELM
jgi:signal transduction histidine kinase